MFTTERSDDALFVFHNGELIYKRWDRLGHGRVFDLHSRSFVPCAQGNAPKQQSEHTPHRTQPTS